MAAPSQTRPDRFAGSLIANPTDLTLPAPYGGTFLGASREMRLHVPRTMAPVVAEEYREDVEYVQGGASATLRGFMRQWDKDTLLALKEETATDADGNPLISSPGSVRAGALGSTRAVKLLLAADAPLTTPSAIIYSAVPEVLEDGIDFSAIVAGAIYARWKGIRDASGRLYQVGYLARMTL